MPRHLTPAIIQIDFEQNTLFFEDGSTADIETYVDEEGDQLPTPENAVGIVFYRDGKCFGALLPDPDSLPTLH